MMDKDFHRTFDFCPCCGGTLQFFKELGEELKDRGLARQGWKQAYEARQGVVVDQNRAIMLPIGAMLPGYYISVDVCMDCGTMYATELRRIEAQTRAAPLQPGVPPPNPGGIGHN